MKKLFTLLTMLVLGIGSSWGQVTNRASAGNPITYADYVASAGKGEKYAFQMPSTNGETYTKWCGLQSSVGNHTNLRVDQLFILEKSSTSGKYWLKRYSNSEYLAGTGDNCFSSTPLDLTLNNRLPDDKSNEYNDQDLHISFDNASGAHFNGGNGNYNFTGGPGSSSGNGGWTTYIAYGPFYIVTFKCKVNGELIYTESVIAKTGDVLNVPDLPGYTASPSSFTVESTDASPEITYTASSYPVNFKREQTFTRSDRHINSVTFDIDGEDQTVNELYNNTSTKCYQDLTDSKTVTLPVNTSVKPKFYALGDWQHGFVYIDLNNDGFFNVDEELVSKINEGNPNLSTDMPSFTTPSTPGEYRMRIKTDWSSTDPGGNTGEAPHEITSSNHIIANGGMIVDVNLVISEYEVTYQVQDENEHVLFTSSAVPTTLGTKITTLPAQYQKADFYDYNTLDITISDLETTAVFTATKKTNPLVQFSSDASSAYYYNLKIRGKYMVYNSGATGEVTLQDNSEPFNPNAAWAFIGDPYAGFKVINKTKGTDQYLTYTSVVPGGNDGSNGSNNNVQFVASADFNNRYWIVDKNNGGFCMRMKENTNIYFHHQNIQNATGYLRTCSVSEWSAVHNDAGSTIMASMDEEVLIALYNNMKDMRFGTGVGEYSTTYVSQDGAAYDISNIGTVIVMGVTDQYASAYTTLLDIESKSTLNLPTSGYYQIKSKYSEDGADYYLSCENTDDSNDPFAKQTTSTDEKNIFYIEVGNSNSTIKSYSTGYYFGKNTRANYTESVNNPIAWTFSEGRNKGTYQLTSTYSGSNFLYGWSGASNNSYADRNPSAADDGHTDWILISIAKEDLPVIEAPGSTETNPVIQGKIESTDDVTDKITASATFVDLSDATISASIDEIKAEVEKINPNAIIIAPEGTSVESTTTNVLLTTDTENTFKCTNLQLNDDVIAQFTTKTNFTADTKVTYTRAATESGWGTIYLPYEPKAEDGVTYYELKESSGSYLKFTKVDNPSANTPYMYKKESEGGMSVTNEITEIGFSLGGDTDPHKGSGVNNYHLVGILTNSSIVENDGIAAKDGYNKIIDPNAYYFKNKDNTFRPLPTSRIFSMKAFRCYLTSSTNARQNVLGISYEENDEPTGISIIESEDGNTVDVIFDLNGRRLQNARKGINIINGKKVIK